MVDNDLSDAQDNNLLLPSNAKQRKRGLNWKSTDPNQALTEELQYTEAGKQAIHNDVKSAYDKVKNNPTAENVANALKERFASQELFEDEAGLKKHIGKPELVNAVDNAVKKAIGADGKISPDKLDAIADDLINKTSGPVTQRPAFDAPYATASMPSQDATIRQSIADLKNMMASGLDANPQMRKIQEGFVKELGGYEGVNKILADSARPDWDPSMLDPKVKETLMKAENARYEITESAPSADILKMVHDFFKDGPPEIVGSVNGGALSDVSNQPSAPTYAPLTPSMGMTGPAPIPSF